MRVPLILAVTLLLLPAPAAFADQAAPAGCHAGTAQTAAEALIHPGATITSLDATRATALAPLIHPGVRFALVQVDGVWCDAQRVGSWPTGDAVSRASAYAEVAATPWFDGVEVLDATEALPGLVKLTTHARTNGIVAEWIVRVDAQGISAARWTATQFAIAPFTPETEGLTALPGASRQFVRGADGLLTPDSPIVPAVAPTLPSPTAVDRMSDEFRIQFFYVATGIYPTTLEPVPLEVVRAVARENYEEFLTWGLAKGWRTNTGAVHVDDTLALQCIACVIISQDFQIHISSAATHALAALGYTYPDDRLAMSTIIGHEMFHNFQNAYSKPSTSVTFMGGAYSEGLARFQETLHDYSWISHQADSLVYATDGNGCNAELGDQSGTPNVHDGPATGQSYSACDFWLTWYATHRIEGIVSLLEASHEHHEKTGWNEIKSIIETATGAPVDADLARFAASILSREGLTWGPASGTGAAFDWGQFLDGWAIPNLPVGNAITQQITDGGMMGARVFQPGTLTWNAPAGTSLYAIRGTTIVPIAEGASITEPSWIVAIHPGVGAATVTLSYA